jgi:hypothetical protein
MPYWWPAVVFGWPAIILPVVLAVTGAASGKPKLGLVSAALALPFSFYLTGAANWMTLAGPSIPLALVGSAYAVHRNVLWVAWSLLAALAAILLLVFVSVWFS